VNDCQWAATSQNWRKKKKRQLIHMRYVIELQQPFRNPYQLGTIWNESKAV
jgi:hypothetical protein